MRAISYIRVSTKKQGQSGLGLEAQRELIGRFLDAQDGYLVEEYLDIASGSKDDRAVLKSAISHAKRINATLVIAKLDRMSRNVTFIASLMDSGINFKIAEMPEATTFQLHIHAALAQEERRLIRERTKASLVAAKARGVQLGKNGKKLAYFNKMGALKFADKFNEIIVTMRDIENLSFSQISRYLNDTKWTSREGKKWHPNTVRRIYLRLRLRAVKNDIGCSPPPNHPFGVKALDQTFDRVLEIATRIEAKKACHFRLL